MVDLGMAFVDNWMVGFRVQLMLVYVVVVGLKESSSFELKAHSFFLSFSKSHILGLCR